MPPCLGDDGPRVQSYEYRLSDDMDIYGERFEVQHQSVEGDLRSYVQSYKCIERYGATHVVHCYRFCALLSCRILDIQR